MRIVVSLIFAILPLIEDAASHETVGLATALNMPIDKAAVIFERSAEGQLSATIVRQDDRTRINLRAPEADVKRLAERLLNSLTPNVETVGSPQDLPTFDADAAHSLFKLLLEPLMAELDGVSRLAIASNGQLAALPFDVLLTKLPTARQRANEDYAAYLWLRKSFVISRLTKTTRPKATPDTLSRVSGGLIGFGNPLFTEDVSMPAPALPEANLELALLRMSLHGRPGKIAIGEKASEARFKQALTSADPLAVLALATHGARVNSDNDDAVLMLAGGDGEDGLLTADDVRALRFRADLVILSACDSGAETLVDAFIEAGGDQVLALRWPVLSGVARQVSSTVVAMTQTNASLTHDIALWRAIDRLIDGGTSSHFSHPIVWAPFVLTTAAA